MKKTHGLSKHPHYKRWTHMIDRCTNINHKSYSDYGGRGITICEEWSRKAGPKAFCMWADKTYTSGLILDRRNNDKGYSPENCRWVDVIISANNKRPRRTCILHKDYKKRSSLPRGVYHKDNKYHTQIQINHRAIHLGTYNTIEEASKVFKQARKDMGRPEIK